MGKRHYALVGSKKGSVPRRTTCWFDGSVRSDLLPVPRALCVKEPFTPAPHTWEKSICGVIFELFLVNC